jgi:ATP-binding cassette subfamily F protein 3
VAQKEFIQRTEEFIRRNIAGQKTRQAQSRRKMLARLERLDRPASEADVASIRFSGAERSSRIVVKAVEAEFAYDELPVVQGLNFEIERGDRIGLVGPNGSGKTTVLKLITGELEPGAGRIDLGKKLSIGYYDQLTENLNPTSTPLQTIWEIKPELNEGQIRAYLARFLFRGEDIFRQVDSFSGGEQSRLALARLIASAPNFLVLDEPTNHLDIPSREALEEALSEFDGTVLCVSHDRYFLDKIAEKIFYLENGGIKISLGNFSDYNQKLSSMAEKNKPAGKKEAGLKTSSRPHEKRVNPIIIRKIEAEITSLEEEIVGIEDLLTLEETATDWQKLSSLLDKRDRLYKELESSYLRLRNLIE